MIAWHAAVDHFCSDDNADGSCAFPALPFFCAPSVSGFAFSAAFFARASSSRHAKPRATSLRYFVSSGVALVPIRVRRLYGRSSRSVRMACRAFESRDRVDDASGGASQSYSPRAARQRIRNMSRSIFSVSPKKWIVDGSLR